MIERLIFLTVLLIVTAESGYGSNWRVHLKVCNQDAACAQEQEKARDLWNKQKWSKELKQTCKKQYILPYWKDYTGAVTCVVQLEKSRQEFQLRASEIQRNNNARRTYRYGYGIRVQ